MADEDWYKPHRPTRRARQPAPGELLFEFVRASDRAPMSCELRFHGESYGWEAQFLERGEILASRGGFGLRELRRRRRRPRMPSGWRSFLEREPE